MNAIRIMSVTMLALVATLVAVVTGHVTRATPVTIGWLCLLVVGAFIAYCAGIAEEADRRAEED